MGALRSRVGRTLLARSAVALLGLGGLALLTWLMAPPSHEVATLAASAPRPRPAIGALADGNHRAEGSSLEEETPFDGHDLSRLATEIRYSSIFELGEGDRVSVVVGGRGTAHLALVQDVEGTLEAPEVREAYVTAPGTTSFSPLPSGRWRIRLAAAPGTAEVRAVVSTGGVSWGRVFLFAAILLLPFAWPYRRKPVQTWRRLTAPDLTPQA